MAFLCIPKQARNWFFHAFKAKFLFIYLNNAAAPSGLPISIQFFIVLFSYQLSFLPLPPSYLQILLYIATKYLTIQHLKTLDFHLRSSFLGLCRSWKSVRITSLPPNGALVPLYVQFIQGYITLFLLYSDALYPQQAKALVEKVSRVAAGYFFRYA